MAKYDVERLLNDLLSIVTTNLNTKIASINSEKNDTIVLDLLDTSKTFFQSLDKLTNVSTKMFLFYGLEDPLIDGLGPYSATKLEIFFILAVADTGDGGAYMTRLLRYMRAMQEIFQDKYSTIPEAGRLRISSLSPVPLSALGSGEFGATGVRIKADLT